jgi:ribosomal protein S18 acetylase RimI-like enzyme
MIIIRAAEAKDAWEVERMARALADHEGLDIAEFKADNFLHDVINSHKIKMLIAETEGKTCGFVMYYPGYDLSTACTGMHMGDLYVDPDYRQLGIGKALVAELAKITLEEGGKWISFTMLPENAEARVFYDSLGAVDIPVTFKAFGQTALKQLL